MKILQTRITIALITLFSVLSLTGCEESWWDEYDSMEGRWRIVEVTGDYNCNYQPGDIWEFEDDLFFASGTGNLNERGNWVRRGNIIRIYMGSQSPDIEAYVKTYEGDYMVLDVKDYYYGSRYTLRMVKEYDYSHKKEMQNKR